MKTRAGCMGLNVKALGTDLRRASISYLTRSKNSSDSTQLLEAVHVPVTTHPLLQRCQRQSFPQPTIRGQAGPPSICHHSLWSPAAREQTTPLVTARPWNLREGQTPDTPRLHSETSQTLFPRAKEMSKWVLTPRSFCCTARKPL